MLNSENDESRENIWGSRQAEETKQQSDLPERNREMNAVYAAFITALFSAWIWELKNQVTELSNGCLVGMGPSRVKHEPSVHRTVENREPTQKTLVNDSTPKKGAEESRHRPSRTNGVPTWVIE